MAQLNITIVIQEAKITVSSPPTSIRIVLLSFCCSPLTVL